MNITRLVERLAAKRAVLRYFELVPTHNDLAQCEAEIQKWSQRRARTLHDIERSGEEVVKLRGDIATLEATLNPHALEKIRELVRITERIQRIQTELDPDEITRIRAWLDADSANSSSDSPA